MKHAAISLILSAASLFIFYRTGVQFFLFLSGVGVGQASIISGIEISLAWRRMQMKSMLKDWES